MKGDIDQQDIRREDGSRLTQAHLKDIVADALAEVENLLGP